MNVEQANNQDFPYLLSQMGFEPVSVKKNGGEYWYRSPFRAEKDASFHISRGHTYEWVWKDFGDEGGTLIDFVMRYHNHKNFAQALAFVRNIFGSRKRRISRESKEQPSFSFHRQAAQPSQPVDKELEFIKAVPIKIPAIFGYLKNRGISKELANIYLEEIHYLNRTTNKRFYAFGMRNESNGYEIRAASDTNAFKSALIARDVTLIEGSQPERRAVNIVEGMTDFLSLLVLFNLSQLGGDTIIMHSLSSYKRTVERIRGREYRAIHTFLDNNDSGRKFSQKFKDEFGIRCNNQSHLFEPHTDLNDALRANIKK